MPLASALPVLSAIISEEREGAEAEAKRLREHATAVAESTEKIDAESESIAGACRASGEPGSQVASQGGRRGTRDQGSMSPLELMVDAVAGGSPGEYPLASVQRVISLAAGRKSRHGRFELSGGTLSAEAAFGSSKPRLTDAPSANRAASSGTPTWAVLPVSCRPLSV